MIYLDTSVVVPLFVPERSSSTVTRYTGGLAAGELAISDWTRAEFASAIGIRVRTGATRKADASQILRAFDSMVAESLVVWPLEPADFTRAAVWMSHFDLALRCGDALHLAVAARKRAVTIVSLDQKLIAIARKLEIPVRSPARA